MSKKISEKQLDIVALVESNLKGWAEVRLGQLSEDQLDELALAMGIADKPLDLPGGKQAVIKALLERKKERSKTPPPSPLGQAPSTEQKQDATEEELEEAATVLQTKLKQKYRGVFVSRHQLKIMSFNSLKLRTGRAGLEEQWLAFAALMGEFDVVMMSEVPAKQALERAQMLLHLIRSCFKTEGDEASQWELRVSDASGPGSPEVHVAFVRSPLRVLTQQTLLNVEGVSMSHAPFQIVVEDPRFELSKQFVITHVHMPPSNKAKERDTQLRLLLRCYATNSSLRSDKPFDPKAAKERKLDEVTHVICGDFNVYPDRTDYLLESNGWADPLLPERVSTSAGGKAYDNFLLDRHASTRYATFSDVMELSIPQNSSKGEIGMSDHDPVVLTLKELPLVGPRSKRVVSAVLKP